MLSSWTQSEWTIAMRVYRVRNTSKGDSAKCGELLFILSGEIISHLDIAHDFRHHLCCRTNSADFYIHVGLMFSLLLSDLTLQCLSYEYSLFLVFYGHC